MTVKGLYFSVTVTGVSILISRTGDRSKNWKYNLMLGSLPLKHLERVVIKNNSVLHREELLEGIGRVRNVVMSPDGYIFLSIETPGKILRLIPSE
ncbi:MAG TPA: PQQ-dependent sugar dehydrogenase [Bacteroidales bacterium]|nr:PQQ-dependent sugar dehydrogenase [Bacteroidales bacterium]